MLGLVYNHAAWFEEMLDVTRRFKKQHSIEVEETLKEVKDAGYPLSEIKSRFLESLVEWIGLKNNIRPDNYRTNCRPLNKSNNPKMRNYFFLSAIQI